jgi:glycosyltransferase involved in cell wall biosynthesis
VKIGFDVSQTGRSKAGCGVFADGLMRALAVQDERHQYVLYATFGDSFWDPDWADSTLKLEGRRFVRAKGHRSLADAQAFWNSGADTEAWLGSPDVIHANNFFCPAELRSARLVYTLYDTAVLDVPEYTTEANRLTCLNGLLRATLNADHIVAISEHTRRRFSHFFPYYPVDRVSVVYPGSRFSRAAVINERLFDLVPRGFWLAVGTLEPRKNYRMLLQAYARHAKRGSVVLPLAIAGGTGWMLESLGAEIAALGLEDRVRLLGYVSDQQLAWLLANSYGLVYPSLYEGFGLPVVEAMSMGTALITSAVTSLPEIVSDCGIVVEPAVEPLAQALDLLALNPALRDEFAARACSRAQLFSWETAAARVRDIYESVVERPRYKIEGSFCPA